MTLVRRILINFDLFNFPARKTLDLMQKAKNSLPGRNDPCHCGSGKKYKVCCAQKGIAAETQPASPTIRPDVSAGISFLNAGRAFENEGKPDEAIASYRRAVELEPRLADAHYLLGNALLNKELLVEAIASFSAALGILPEHPDIINGLGVALHRMRRLEQAAVCYRKAISLKPECPDFHANLGLTLQNLGLKAEAVASYQQAIRLKPASEAAYSNLGNTLLEMGRIKEANESYLRALEIRPDFAAAYSNMLYLHATTRDISLEAERALAEGWEKCVLTEAERLAARRRRCDGTFRRLPRAGRKLRIGIVSAELGKHAVAEFLEPFLQELDKERFHLTLFPTVAWSDLTSGRLQALADQNISLVGVPFAQAADRVRAEQIDILMDTTGHTGNCHLQIFAHRAAPVQLTYIGYWSTTGLTEMDWCFADHDLPVCCERQFTEGLWRLPGVATCYRGDHALPESAWQPGDTIWLGSFNRYYKIGEETLVLWARVLAALPQARLLLEDRARNEDVPHRRILATLAGNGIAAERVEFIPAIFDHREHMRQYDRLDVALDTIPFNSGTTAMDALWMGVPLVALEGDWSGGTIASSALKALGRQEWIAQSADEYVSIVRSLIEDVEGRKEFRRAQRARMTASPLCDASGLARTIGDAFEAMYDRWLESQTEDSRK